MLTFRTGFPEKFGNLLKKRIIQMFHLVVSPSQEGPRHRGGRRPRSGGKRWPRQAARRAGAWSRRAAAGGPGALTLLDWGKFGDQMRWIIFPGVSSRKKKRSFLFKFSKWINLSSLTVSQKTYGKFR